MKRLTILIPGLLAVAAASDALAADFTRLDEALPGNNVINGNEPVFDFDTDGCLPAAGISRSGEPNPGLNNSGSITGECREDNFLELSNTLHRYACLVEQGNEYCGHFYSLYFEKDQTMDGWDWFGHRHDWEYVAVWTINGEISHGSYSAHGDLTTATAATLPMEGAHIKFVYHKEGGLTHAMRFAKPDEVAENGYGYFVTPAIVSWYELVGDGLDNQAMRDRLNSFDYGKATIPLKDSNFLTNLNRFRPSGYPPFTQASIEAADISF
ncbi:sugar-binding protein [Photobacterium gaetbulicola]|uniref:Necrosis inducing n=1 Tax=Photobacterium gaetbulicola Gung47 TaxID=658445 RepID=A0A0C5WER3_9GAMM|nr:NPP1 family protein [Photobacterium gaetbulicola]AJR05623.1 Necrosis inducing [Photobacterium gaetbulicola Gung47]PSU14602.1 sugar-binding protein [Photobacterium gaetbulicola]